MKLLYPLPYFHTPFSAYFVFTHHHLIGYIFYSFFFFLVSSF